MSVTSRDLVFLILQFLREHPKIKEERFKETMCKLEQESGLYFNYKYIEGEILKGNWDDAEKYLSSFTKVDDNIYSMKTFFEIRKHKYLEALDEHDWAKARNILVKDLKVFASFNKNLFVDLTQLLTLDNFRENGNLKGYLDAKWNRTVMLPELKILIEANPIFRGKLQFPNLENSSLTNLIDLSLRLQHQRCNSPKPDMPVIKTLFVDHACEQPNDAYGPAPTPEDPASLASFLASSPYLKPASKRVRSMGISDEVPDNESSSANPQPQR